VWDAALGLAREREVFTLQEVIASIETDVSRQTTHDVLVTMAEMGYLEKDDQPTGVWRESPERSQRRRKATQESIVRATVM
jgi:DNA-binding IclR family transcriptional regulator